MRVASKSHKRSRNTLYRHEPRVSEALRLARGPLGTARSERLERRGGGRQRGADWQRVRACQLKALPLSSRCAMDAAVRFGPEQKYRHAMLQSSSQSTISSWADSPKCRRARCSLDDVLADHAGPDAVDCGHVRLHASRSAVDSCVATNLLAARPFYAVYEYEEIDSRLARAVARAPSGSVALYLYDGDPTGRGAEAHPRVESALCENAAPTASLGDVKEWPVACSKYIDRGRLCDDP